MKLSDGIIPFSDAWHNTRNGKLTSSLIHSIFVSGRSKADLIGVGGITYIDKKIGEILTGLVSDEMGDNLPPDVMRGLANEPWGISRYEEVTNARVHDSLLFEYNAIACGTTDGQILNKANEIDAIIEVKCPRPHKHVKICAVDAPVELKAIDPQYYHQPQANMLFTGANYCDFISYNDEIKHYDLQIRIVRLYPDMEWRADFTERINWIADYINEKLTKILLTPERNLMFRIEKLDEGVDKLKSAIDDIRAIAN